jgi:Cu(I)/Ag(I) efflux system membrane fusion protein
MNKMVFKILLASIILAVIGFLVLNWSGIGSQDSEAEKEETALEHAKLHTDPTYVCPMHSQITDTQPGSCPICGMDLELRASSPQPQESGLQQDENSKDVFVSAAMVNNLGVHLEHVDIGQVAEEVYASGFVEKVSDAQEKSISSKVSGRLQDVAVERGQWVEEGEVLLTIDVASYDETVKKYVEAMENSLIAEALKLRKKLQAMGVGDEVLAGYDQDRPLSRYLEIVAPFSGEVTWVLDSEEIDKKIEIGNRLVQVTAPSLAEVDLRSYSRVARGVKVGHAGNMGVAHMPGRIWPGRVVEVIHNRAGFYTVFRFHVLVPYGVLEPGAFGGAYVNAGTAENVLRIPASAIIYDENSTRVIRLADENHFEVVEVTLGFEGHKWVEVKSGLQKGDHVVTRGQFLIDSEATLQAGFKRLSN